jgi:hypothetical protein
MAKKHKNRITKFITSYYRESYYSNALLVPSARFGIYAVAKTLFFPGARILISPITCKTVIHSLLAAEVFPIFVDIDINSGNIDLRNLPKQLFPLVQGIFTTNLYGNPDSAIELRKVAKANGLFLIEDCAHVIDSRIGKHRIGAIGDVSIFSFKKYFGHPGGIVCTDNSFFAAKIEKIVHDLSLPPAPLFQKIKRLIYYFQPKASVHLRRTSPQQGSRPQNISDKTDFQKPAKSRVLPKKFAWRTFASRNSDFRTLPTTTSLSKVKDKLNNIDAFLLELDNAKNEAIRDCPLPMKFSTIGTKTRHFVLPFFSHKRDEIVGTMNQKGIPTWFLYNPPMNKLFSGICKNELDLNQSVLDEWTKTILPINPVYIAEYITVIRALESRKTISVF